MKILMKRILFISVLFFLSVSTYLAAQQARSFPSKTTKVTGSVRTGSDIGESKAIKNSLLHGL